MALNSETPISVSFKKLEEAKEARKQAVDDFRNKYKEYLVTCLSEVGFAHKRVRVKSSGAVGELKVVQGNNIHSYYPSCIHFFPLKTNGELSLKSKFIPGFFSFAEESLPDTLKQFFELVGEENEC